MHVVADFGAFGERDSLHADEVGYLVQIFLWVGAQLIIHGNEHVLAAEVFEPFAQMERIACDLGDGPLTGRVAKMPRVPVDALVVVGAEELGFLDSIGQIDAAFEHAMQPGGSGASGTGADEHRVPALDGHAHRLTDRWTRRAVQASMMRGSRDFFHAERSIISNSSSVSTSGIKCSRRPASCSGVSGRNGSPRPLQNSHT